VAEFFEEAVSEAEKSTPQLIYNYLTSDLLGLANAAGIKIKESKVKPVDLAHLMDLVQSGVLNSRSAKNVLAKMWATGADPHQLIKEEGLNQITDEATLAETVAKVIKAHPKAVTDYRQGRANALQFLIGRAMAELRGRGNPELLEKLILEKLAK
jgi:aspartyl-tRNA(Asn)/glutamyl-tRNA(Gln) amidotransferase subunit B